MVEFPFKMNNVETIAVKIGQLLPFTQISSYSPYSQTTNFSDRFCVHSFALELLANVAAM